MKKSGQAQRQAARELRFGGVLGYEPVREATDQLAIAPRHELFVDARWTKPRTGRYLTTIDPATGRPLAEVARAGEADVSAAVRAAQRAFGGWRAAAGERARTLFRIARRLGERAREFACLEALDTGKPVRLVRDVDVPLAAQHFFHHAGWADKLELAFPGRRAEPLGVVAVVLGASTPLPAAAARIAPALAAGNTVVLKPSASAPLTALRLAEVCAEAGLPPGVVGVVTGDDRTGALLVRHPGLAVVSFAGSTATGRQVRRALAGRAVGLALEPGGKAAHVVCEDAALDQAVEGIVRATFGNHGHAGCAGARLLVQEGVHDRLVGKLRRRLQRLRVGDPLDENTDVGAVGNAARLARIRELVAAGVDDGAELHQPAGELPAKGHWFLPTLFTNVAPHHRIACEEIPGPVLAVLTFRTPDEAVALANAPSPGLAASVWTDKGARILWFAQRLRAGVVWNDTCDRFDAASPFGGRSAPGSGRTGGRQGLRACVQLAGDLLPG